MLQAVDNFERWGLADIVHIRFVGNSQTGNNGILEGCCGSEYLLDDTFRTIIIDQTGLTDETRGRRELFHKKPWVNRDAMATNPWSGR
jgi:hypothetical protein